MSIPLNCSQCEEPLLAPDHRAGQSVRCPHCEAISPVPVPAPTVRREPPRAGAAARADDPALTAWESGPPAGAAPDLRPPWRGPGAGAGPGPRESWRGPPGRWLPFSNGCRCIEYGIAIEFLGIMLLFVFAAYGILADLGVKVALPKAEYTASLFTVPLLLGSGFIGTGRLVALRVPLGSGGLGVLCGAALLSLVRFVALLSGLIFLALAVHEGANGARGLYFDWFGRVLLLAGVAGLVAEVSVVPGMAAVAGAMPSASLRRRAGLVALVLQLMAAAWVALLALVIYADLLAEFLPRALGPAPAPNPRPGPVARPPAAPVPPERRALVLSGVLAGAFVFQAVYSYLHYSLYAVGRAAGRTDGDRYPS